ncbi:hypothetical protein BDY19DRAFT_900038 [Irpex rosettiformis]|uniref:Uncharacterized protein n=1 Tax=Irpex rosettiformis TaxID=378272 RepID=A0ACB8TNM4_9APHY|nr:hypothetical protein BDY19DRAFT_900038 [Irpex rosettiformis]
MNLPTTVPTPHRTPLRRLSQGSLSRLTRSGAYPDAPHGLGFLDPALSELLDEVETLQGNVEGLRNLGDALSVFNESFASWLYVMNMNALTTDWPQAPTDASFKLAARRAEEDARAAMEALRLAQIPPPPPPSAPDVSAMDRTAYTDIESEMNLTTANAGASSSNSGAVKGILKKKGKPKLTNKEKKERAMEIERIVSSLPLEFRGNDPTLRRNIETVIIGFLDREGRGLPILELVKPPDLNQARVNKCLIALVNRKIVRKDNSTGAVLYHWHGLPI